MKIRLNDNNRRNQREHWDKEIDFENGASFRFRTASPVKIIVILIFVVAAFIYAQKTDPGPKKSSGTGYSDTYQESGEASGSGWDVEAAVYYFRDEDLLNQHFEKHGEEFDYATAAEYETGANAVINNPDSLQKEEKEDGDYVFYLEATNEFVVLSKDGYIRTYFKPTDGIDYFNRQ